jgi:ABC-type dipeptide/oligopeptide/nickel transport system permease component
MYILPTLLGITVFSFVLISLSPGDPVQIRIGLFYGEQTEYEDKYHEIAVEIGMEKKVGEDIQKFQIKMTDDGFSKESITVVGPGGRNTQFATVILELTSDKARIFSIPSYNLQIAVPQYNVPVEVEFLANKTSYNSQGQLTTLFNYTATDISESGEMIIEETSYEKIGVVTRYFQWLGLMPKYGDKMPDGILEGNFGRSWHFIETGLKGKKITDIIVSRMWYTLFLTTPAFVISTVLATIIGVIQATRQYSFWDKGVTLASLVGYSMPTFWLAKLVMLASFYMFDFTGATQASAFSEPFLINPTFYLYLILPTITLVLTTLVFLSRLTRSQLLDILRQDYIITARAKGLSERKVIYKHAFRNAMLPIITVVGLALPNLLGGAVMTEGVFGYPGLGTVFLTSSLQRDHPMMMATNFLFGGLFLVFRLLVDLSYAFVDPRIRY